MRIGIAISLLIWLGIFHLFNTAQAGFYLEIGVGKNDVLNKNNWLGRESLGCFAAGGYVWRLEKGYSLDLSFTHHSQCTRGDGFDDREEQTLDAIYFKVKKEWN